jgi:hypothetical protein
MAIAACGPLGERAGALRTGSGPGREAPAASPLAEVGRLEISGAPRCWATLITPSHAITAAHCLTQGMDQVTPGDAVLALDLGGERHRFPIDRTRSFGGASPPASAALNGDVALLRLARAVPASLATPRPLARARAASGDEVTFVGVDPSGNAPRRLTTWRFDPAREERVMVPGDSGGPLLLGAPGALGPLVAVGSGYAGTPCAAAARDRMLFGDAAGMRLAIENTIAAWEAEARRGLAASPDFGP